MVKFKAATVEPPLTVTSLQQPLSSFPKVAVVERFAILKSYYCNYWNVLVSFCITSETNLQLHNVLHLFFFVLRFKVAQMCCQDLLSFLQTMESLGFPQFLNSSVDPM